MTTLVTFEIYGDMSCYIENNLQICLNRLDLHEVNLTYHQLIWDSKALNFLGKFKNYKIDVPLMTSLLDWVTNFNHNSKNG